MAEETECYKCAKKGDPVTYQRCPSCYKMVCQECRHNIRGRFFCSSHCAQFYFFESEEES